MTALGFIETKGLVAAISGADAMLKAAEVRLLGKDLVGGGLVTITVAGEVAAVRASVDAGIAAVRSVAGTLVSEHVIARPDVELGHIIAVKPPTAPSAPPTGSTGTMPKAGKPECAPAATSDIERHDVAHLSAMRVNKLRQLARSLSQIAMTPKEINFADKKVLLEKIVNAYRQIEE